MEVGKQRKALAWQVERQSSHNDNLILDEWVACTVLIPLWGTNQDECEKIQLTDGVDIWKPEEMKRFQTQREMDINSCTCTKKVYARSGSSFGFCGRTLLRHRIKHI